MKKILEPKFGLAPNPVALITSGDKENTDISTIAWTGILNSEPMIVYVSIRPSRYTNELIRKNNRVTAENIAAEIGVSSKTVKRHIKRMDYIKYIGSGYSGHWEIIE